MDALEQIARIDLVRDVTKGRDVLAVVLGDKVVRLPLTGGPAKTLTSLAREVGGLDRAVAKVFGVGLDAGRLAADAAASSRQAMESALSDLAASKAARAEMEAALLEDLKAAGAKADDATSKLSEADKARAEAEAALSQKVSALDALAKRATDAEARIEEQRRTIESLQAKLEG